MQIKYTLHFLHRLEDIFSESSYVLRYEKGSFHSGFCILKDMKVAIVNKYFSQEGKINSLIEILRTIDISPNELSERNQKLFFEITQTELILKTSK